MHTQKAGPPTFIATNFRGRQIAGKTIGWKFEKTSQTAALLAQQAHSLQSITASILSFAIMDLSCKPGLNSLRDISPGS
jgi:hypothetical protein